MSNTKPAKPLFTVLKDAAVVLGFSEHMTRGLTEDGTLPSTKVGGRIYIPTESLQAYVESVMGGSAKDVDDSLEAKSA